jgi:hypothetical protein
MRLMLLVSAQTKMEGSCQQEPSICSMPAVNTSGEEAGCYRLLHYFFFFFVPFFFVAFFFVAFFFFAIVVLLSAE